jgi:hypothetical protein
LCAHVCSDACIAWLEIRYPGIYRGQDHYNHWLFYTAKDVYLSDVPRQQALRFMLVCAVNPPSVPRDWRAQLRAHGWRAEQVRRRCLLLPLRRLCCLAHLRGHVFWQATATSGSA